MRLMPRFFVLQRERNGGGHRPRAGAVVLRFVADIVVDFCTVVIIFLFHGLDSGQQSGEGLELEVS